jgi:hypothetical protein
MDWTLHLHSRARRSCPAAQTIRMASVEGPMTCSTGRIKNAFRRVRNLWSRWFRSTTGLHPGAGIAFCAWRPAVDAERHPALRERSSDRRSGLAERAELASVPKYSHESSPESAAYYNDYRQQRHPDEQLSIGRSFRIREGVAFSFRGEFFNAFNRTILATPSSGNPTATTTTDSRGLSGGFGYINALNSGTPRNGQVVLRLQF